MKEIGEKLKAVIKDLSDRDRTILTLYYFEQMNYKEIANIFAVNVDTISLVHTAILNKLKKALT